MSAHGSGSAPIEALSHMQRRSTVDVQPLRRRSAGPWKRWARFREATSTLLWEGQCLTHTDRLELMLLSHQCLSSMELYTTAHDVNESNGDTQVDICSGDSVKGSWLERTIERQVSAHYVFVSWLQSFGLRVDWILHPRLQKRKRVQLWATRCQVWWNNRRITASWWKKYEFELFVES